MIFNGVSRILDPAVVRNWPPLFSAVTINFFNVFGRTDLRKGVSKAKSDAEADFDVKKCLAPPKSAENLEKLKKKSEKFQKKTNIYQETD